MMEFDEEDMKYVNYNKCISGQLISETDDEDGENQGREDMEDNDSDNVEVMCEEDI